MAKLSALAAPRSSIDDIIDLYKKDIDVTLIDENLKLTPEQRVLKLLSFLEMVAELQAAGRRMRGEE